MARRIQRLGRGADLGSRVMKPNGRRRHFEAPEQLVERLRFVDAARWLHHERHGALRHVEAHGHSQRVLVRVRRVRAGLRVAHRVRVSRKQLVAEGGQVVEGRGGAAAALRFVDGDAEQRVTPDVVDGIAVLAEDARQTVRLECGALFAGFEAVSVGGLTCARRCRISLCWFRDAPARAFA